MGYSSRLNTALVLILMMLLLPVVSSAIQDGKNVTFQTGSEGGEAVSQLLLSLKKIVFYGFKALLDIFINLVSNCWTVSNILITMLVFADSHNWIFNVVLSIILVVATIMIANENRAIRKSQTEPNIAVDIQQKSEFHQLIYLGIQNIGLGPAYEITFNLNGSDFKINSELHLSQVGIMRKGLKYLRPGYRRLIYLFSLHDPNFEKIIMNKLRISVSYRNSIGEYKTEEFSIDLYQFQGLKSIASTEYEAKKQIETATWSIGTTTSGTSDTTYVSKDPRSHVSDGDYRYEE